MSGEGSERHSEITKKSVQTQEGQIQRKAI